MIANNTKQLDQMHVISENMRGGATNAVEQFEELNKVMQNVKESIRFLSQQANLTSESAAKISSAAELITTIASQTNLLSLNASIEEILHLLKIFTMSLETFLPKPKR